MPRTIRQEPPYTPPPSKRTIKPQTQPTGGAAQLETVKRALQGVTAGPSGPMRRRPMGPTSSLIPPGAMTMGRIVDRGASYEKGGDVKKTGPAFLHKGEKVIPAKKEKKQSLKSQGMKR